MVDAVTLVFAVVGILSILKWLVLKFMSWKEERFTIVLPLFSEDEEIVNHIDNLRALLEYVGIYKKSTIALINYGASEWFVNKLKEKYDFSEFLKIYDSTKAGEGLKEIMSSLN